MKKLKELLKPTESANAPAERFSLHVRNGVEIYEHESRRTFVIDPANLDDQPRLLIGEAERSAEVFVTKSRSEISGLNAFLNSVIGRPEMAK